MYIIVSISSYTGSPNNNKPERGFGPKPEIGIFQTLEFRIQMTGEFFKIPDVLLVEEYFRIYFICTAKFLTSTKLIHFENDRKSLTNIPIRQLDDHGFLLKLFKNFEQNSGGQPQSNQMTIEFFKSQMTSEFL